MIDNGLANDEDCALTDAEVADRLLTRYPENARAWARGNTQDRLTTDVHGGARSTIAAVPVDGDI
jgi:hypothetical protein